MHRPLLPIAAALTFFNVGRAGATPPEVCNAMILSARFETASAMEFVRREEEERAALLFTAMQPHVAQLRRRRISAI